MSGSAKQTTDHETIRRWAEERGGRPATVASTHRGEEAGVLRIDFEGDGKDDKLEEISWDTFFRKFEDSHLAFLYQEEKEGDKSRFFKLVNRG